MPRMSSVSGPRTGQVDFCEAESEILTGWPSDTGAFLEINNVRDRLWKDEDISQ